MTSGPILCCGCGKEAVGGVKPCNCPTGCGFRKGEPGSVWLIPRGQAKRNELAYLIKTRLIGVEPDSQDLVLEDHDWREIVAALEGKAALENGPSGLADATNDPADPDLSSLRKGAEVMREAIEDAIEKLNTYRGAAVQTVIDQLEAALVSGSREEQS